MYRKVDTSLNFIEREKEIISFWKENGIFEQSVERNEGGEEFSFYDGPPTANGKPSSPRSFSTSSSTGRP